MKEWKTVTLGEVTSFMSKGIAPVYTDERAEGAVVVLNQKCNRNFSISFEESRLHDANIKRVPNDRILLPGDVLINSTGAGTAGRVAQIWNVPSLTTVDGHMIILRCTDSVDPLYYGYALKLHQSQIESLAEGSTGQTEINRKRLCDEVLISYPTDISLQRKIARTLAALDEKIEANRNINDNLFAQAQAVFVHRFITDEVKGNEKSLYDFADYINGAAFKPSECGDRGLPIIKIVELKNGITDSTKRFDGFKGEKYLIQNKDILFSWSGNPDTSIDIFIWTHGKAILNQHTFNVKSHTGHHWFTFLMLKYFKPEFSRIASNKQTTGLGHVTATDLKRLTFVFNEDVIEAFEHEISPFMETIYSNMLENQRLEQLRNNLLPKLMANEIDVTDIQL